MPHKKQKLTIQIIDHRKAGQDGHVRTKEYDNHKEYLRDMAQIAKANAHISEHTETAVHLYPLEKGNLFEQEEAPGQGP